MADQTTRLTADCPECGKEVMWPDRTTENRPDSPAWHSWCYARMWKARAEQAEQRVKDMERVGVAFCEQMERANVELPLDAISEYNALAVLLSRRGREG